MGDANPDRCNPHPDCDSAGIGSGPGPVGYPQAQETTRQIAALIHAGRIKLFYKRKEWRRKRRQILRRDNYECQRCKREGEQAQATCVHHKKHLDKHPELALVDSNLESLCDACHNQEHPEKLKRVEIDRKEYITPERW